MVAPRFMRTASFIKLRNRLIDRGRPSIFPRPLGVVPEAKAAYERVLPFAELMYLIVSADHEVADRERDALLGALRSLTDGQASTLALEQMMAGFEHKKREHGHDACLDDATTALAADKEDRELAWALAAAVALADDQLVDPERGVLTELAIRLGISTERQRELLEWSA